MRKSAQSPSSFWFSILGVKSGWELGWVEGVYKELKTEALVERWLEGALCTFRSREELSEHVFAQFHHMLRTTLLRTAGLACQECAPADADSGAGAQASFRAGFRDDGLQRCCIGGFQEPEANLLGSGIV